ncbi:RagB/SusD family nutrient uptake outer membrane protein [Flavobacteriaceae bacterium GSB9]|nr:RagB/SusD family nutrient uptake outer membrane protein [Flavobacteriaceae bacterium GSB9]
MKLLKILSSVAAVAVLASCTNLDEDLYSNLPREEAETFLTENADFSALLEKAYRNFDSRFIQHAQSVWLLQEISADAAVVPSRPSGWDNGGVFREIHQHTWTPENGYIQTLWRNLNRGTFDATNILSFAPNVEIEAEARFLRAYFMYTVLDLYGQVPFREPGDNLLEPSTVLKGQEAVDFIISEVEWALPNLPATGPAYLASQNAARGLLAVLYINRGVYDNKANPQFSNADMDKVIEYVDALQGLELDFYWDSFGPDNNEVSSELVFTIESRGGILNNSLWVWWSAIFPSEIPLPTGGGWNGYASTPEVYDLFQEGDVRMYYEHPITQEYGYNAGFLTGQQYNADGTPIPDVVFTKEIPTINGASLWNGYRPVKYIPDYNNPRSADNDWVLLRYSNMLLLKAEALLRKGESGALDIVNELREARDLDPLTEINLDVLLDVRGRELYWEGHRRQDMIRFGKFLGSWTLKEASDAKYLVYPIPPADVLANSNLEQNEGY